MRICPFTPEEICAQERCELYTIDSKTDPDQCVFKSMATSFRSIALSLESIDSKMVNQNKE
jgi:hypothetical protein